MILEKEIVVMVRFRAKQDDGSLALSDTLTLTEAEHAALSSADTDARCLQRYGDYLARIEAERIASVHEFTAQQIETQNRWLALAPPDLAKDILLQQRAIIDAQLVDADAKSAALLAPAPAAPAQIVSA